jgi:hypothetical protein
MNGALAYGVVKTWFCSPLVMAATESFAGAECVAASGHRG